VEDFLSRNPGLRRAPSVEASLPTELLTDAGDFQSLPQRHGIDGAYAARLVRASYAHPPPLRAVSGFQNHSEILEVVGHRRRDGARGVSHAYLIIFPAPISARPPGVPRVLGLTLRKRRRNSKGQTAGHDGGAEPHPTAPAGIVIWQDPPPGVVAPEGTKVTLVSSAGPPKIPVPDVSRLDATLAQSLIAAAGTGGEPGGVGPGRLARGSRDAHAADRGDALVPGAGVTIVVSRGAPTIPIPDLLGMASGDARTRLENEGLQLAR